jgi:hypothetical protein
MKVDNVLQNPIPSIFKPEKSENEIDVAPNKDVLTSIVGEFGRFQFFNLLMIGISTMMDGTNNFVTKFLAHEVDYWCAKVLILFLEN